MPQDEAHLDSPVSNAAESSPPAAEASESCQGLELALRKCQARGMRVSRQRRYILELLWRTREHLTAREIYDHLSREGCDIGHTSVYQNLEALSSQQIIECVERAGGRLYGSLSESHSHVTCVDSKQILDVQVALPSELIEAVEQQTGVKIVDYRIDFFGRRQD